MNRSMNLCIALLALCASAAAQDVYKCRDAAGKITYSGSECHLIGLTSAGEVTGRASVTPALQFQPAPPAPVAAPGNRPAAPNQSTAGAPAEPEKRCFTVKTAKGTAIHCNDVPEEEAGSK